MLQALLFGLLLAIPISIPFLIIGGSEGDAATVVAQIATVLGFLAVPMLVATRGGASKREALRRLGVRRFRVRSALLWVFLAIVAYLALAFLYATVIGEPEQDDIADEFGPLPVQILLIVFAAGISEEICFRGMLFGGLRERFHWVWAALISAVIFGVLHALTGLSAVPPLIVIGFMLAMVYEKTGSIVPAILFHMLNNSVALLAQ